MPPRNTPTKDGAGDAEAALALIRALRRDGIHATSVKVGEVRVEMLAIVDHKASSTAQVEPSRKSVIEEWGGAEFAKQLDAQPDLVDDEDQPAVRS